MTLARSALVIAGLSLVLGCSVPTQAPIQASADLKDKDGRSVGMATFHEVLFEKVKGG